jgi:Fe-S cluster assembly iron-binding protein IscA
MLQVTPAATNYLSALLSAKIPSTNAAVRMYRGDSGDLQLRADSPSPDDVAFEHHGRPVLVLDKQLSDTLKDCVLDVVQSPEGQALALKG